MHNVIFRSKMINNDITRTDILSFWLSALFQMPNPSLPYTFDQLPVYYQAEMMLQQAIAFNIYPQPPPSPFLDI